MFLRLCDAITCALEVAQDRSDYGNEDADIPEYDQAFRFLLHLRFSAITYDLGDVPHPAERG